ncbi:MAG TPA: mechanosensitive ion channel domain-containing protein [Myxococcota bacterium]
MDRLQQWLTDNFQLPVSWPLALAVAVLVWVLLEVLYRVAFRWLEKLVGMTNTTLDDVLVKRMRLPAHVLVTLIAAHVFIALRNVDDATVSMIVTITELLLIAYLVIEAVETALLHYWLGERKGIQVPNVVRHLILVIAWTVAVLSIIGGVTGVNVAPLLATSTVLTVVVGLALQETLGNLFAGLAISMDRPFSVGDWILVDGIEGNVVHVGWRATQLQTFTKDIVVIPNSILGKARLQNFYLPSKIVGRNQEILVALHAAPVDVEAAVAAAINNVPAILDTPAHKVWFVATTPLFHRYVIRIYLADFAGHDDAESDFMKALFPELLARRLNVVAAAAGVGADGVPVAVAR